MTYETWRVDSTSENVFFHVYEMMTSHNVIIALSCLNDGHPLDHHLGFLDFSKKKFLDLSNEKKNLLFLSNSQFW